MKKVFQCMHTMGRSAPSLQEESKDSDMYMYIPSVLKHSLMLSIVCSCMFGTHVHVLMSMSMLCANGWEAPKLKGTFCL